eukprot:TRINITY_DN3988_c0_g2_i5.p1 TRINITY_DN3988_c0_g2~~TRINITY_DN3988_c0_g2_i5.p1  ORF type:complete len:135 (+),score=25.84 TRINITY_DN3988_c0_g2_i5:392-796(+)
MVTCFLRGTKYCIYDKLNISFTPEPTVTKTIHDTERDWRMAKKYLEKGNLARAKKTLVHSLRVILLTTEVIKTGEISDFTLGLEYHHMMQSMYHTEWEVYRSTFCPILTEAFADLKICFEEQFGKEPQITLNLG